MDSSRLAGLLGVGVVSALALGGLATFLRGVLPSSRVVPAVVVLGLVALAVVAAVRLGSEDVPDRTPYW